MTPRVIFPLRWAKPCFECGILMPPGTMAHRSPEKNYRCMTCAPRTILPKATAEGAVDSSRKPMMTMEHAKALAIGRSLPHPGRRRRLPSRLRRAQQHNND